MLSVRLFSLSCIPTLSTTSPNCYTITYMAFCEAFCEDLFKLSMQLFRNTPHVLPYFLRDTADAQPSNG